MIRSRNYVSNGQCSYESNLIAFQEKSPFPVEEEESINSLKSTKCMLLKAVFTMKSSIRYLLMLSLLAMIGYKVASLRNCPQADPLCSIKYLKYAIIFDAGSTGSRIHIFNFKNNSALGIYGDEMVLQEELFKEVKPGLSSYSEIPALAANSLVPLLDYALKMIPQEAWPETPIMLKATAGLRLLSDSKAEAILREVEQMFLQYPFQFSKGYVSMMSGEDEGICGWITINFLLGRLNDKEKSVITLDLGGGSTQVTFIPSSPYTLASSPKDYFVSRRYFNSIISLYTHSYLGLGLMATRHAILSATSEIKTFPNGTIILQSPCIHEGIRELWTYGVQNFLVTSTDKANQKQCQEIISEYVKSFNVHKPSEMNSKPLYATSYYYDRALDLGIIENVPRATVSLQTYREAATKACETSKPEFPFLCLDSTYIMTLLTEGLGVDESKFLVVSQQISGVETSWGLGAGFQAIYQNL